MRNSVLDATETIRKLDSFDFLQWFGIVCSLMGGAAMGLIVGAIASIGEDIFVPKHSTWHHLIGAALAIAGTLAGAYIGVKAFIKRQS